MVGRQSVKGTGVPENDLFKVQVADQWSRMHLSVAEWASLAVIADMQAHLSLCPIVRCRRQ